MSNTENTPSRMAALFNITNRDIYGRSPLQQLISRKVSEFLKSQPRAESDDGHDGMSVEGSAAPPKHPHKDAVLAALEEFTSREDYAFSLHGSDIDEEGHRGWNDAMTIAHLGGYEALKSAVDKGLRFGYKGINQGKETAFMVIAKECYDEENRDNTGLTMAIQHGLEFNPTAKDYRGKTEADYWKEYKPSTLPYSYAQIHAIMAAVRAAEKAAADEGVESNHPYKEELELMAD